MSPDIYASDPAPAPDDEFAAGQLHHLVVGNRGRRLDARRTPVSITAVLPELGAFEVRIEAFEDAGARWELPLQEVKRFQFALDGAEADAADLGELKRALARFDRSLSIEADPGLREDTLRRIAAARESLAPVLGAVELDLERRVAERQGEPRLFSLLDEVMDDRGLTELDQGFTHRFASNPHSGELVKGHAIVLAELGICRYQGQVVRHPELFSEPWSKARRAEHVITRLAFVQALLAGAGWEEVTLYRGASSEGGLTHVTPQSFVSATFSRQVAQEHFEGGEATRASAMWRQVVPLRRLFMTFLETRELNRHFHEAEAVLVGEPGNAAF